MMKVSRGIVFFLLLILCGGGYAYYKTFGFDFLSRTKNCVPYNLLVDKQQGEILIKWETEDECSGVVKFGSDIEDLNYWLYSQSVRGKSHVVIDKNRYKEINYFVVISNGALYGLNGKVIPIN